MMTFIQNDRVSLDKPNPVEQAKQAKTIKEQAFKVSGIVLRSYMK